MATKPAQRSYQFWDTLAATPDIFDLDAGKYGLTLIASVWGTATLSRVMRINGANVFIPLFANIVANSYTVLELPAGKYQLTVAGVTALSGAIEQIAPGRMGG